ncbi:hypothetical protein LTR56_004014 [Elasticomyces elasticus]|nr:hypothetical protein LTR22_023571 [Elasticomyces elasticus]KAK3654384.1 hypothetical protein LTR56_004014 [Elasticomyces elasticus]KAK5765454.1 hypothetical protein LTS12_004467 [Elasticomyces elasticus]
MDPEYGSNPTTPCFYGLESDMSQCGTATPTPINDSAALMIGRTLIDRETVNQKYDHDVAERKLPGLPQDDTIQTLNDDWVRRVCVALWLWEALSLLTSIFCIGGVVVLLCLYDGEPLPSWSYGLTINGVISILAVVTKASMVLPIAEALSQLKWNHFWRNSRPVRDFESFDSASRGPWGSLVMMFSMRLWSLGSLGAALTVAAMLVEPALQQIPAYPTRVVRINDTLVSRNLNFTDRVPVAGGAGFSLSEGLKSAMYTGIFGDEATVVHPPNCATGNCTWPIFTSLGICSACEDLSSRLVRSSERLGVGWQVPSNDSTTQGLGHVSRRDWMYLQDSSAAGQIVFGGLGSHAILDFQSIYWPPHSTGNDPPSGVFECVLHFCVKTFSATTTGGHFSETVLATWPPANTSMPEQPTIDISADFPVGTKLTAAASERKENFTLTPPGADISYAVDRLTFDLLRHWAGNGMFTGIIPYNPIEDDHARVFDVADIMGIMYNELTDLLGPNKTIHGFSVPSTAGPGRLMAKIATSLTSFMRRSESGTLAVSGETIHYESFVQARWYWLAGPLSLLLLTFVLMLSTILLSARHGVPTWKSSSLAVLVHGLNDLGSRAMTDTRLDKLEKNASDYRMAVQQHQGLWTLEARRA